MIKNFVLPDLIEIQRASFISFLEKGLSEELENISSIKTEDGKLELILHTSKLKFKRPKFSPQDAIKKAQTYSAALYVPAQINYNNRFKSKLQNICFGEIPLMTERGTFIINGSPRVIVNQIVRSPGIYYKAEFNKENQKTFTGTIISNRGSWFRIETDKDGYVWAKIDKVKKIPIFILLQAFGLPQKKIFYAVRHPEFLVKSLEKGNPTTTFEALILLHSLLRPDKQATVKDARNLIYSNFMDPKRYDLGEVGRLKLNKKLKISTSPKCRSLRPEDILAAIDYLINLDFGIGSIDDIDDLKNRRIRSSGELIQNQIRIGISRVERITHEKLEKFQKKENITNSQLLNKNSKLKTQLDNVHTPATLISSKPLISSLREFFGSSQLSQFMDETNSLSEITHKRRITSFGPGGLNRERAGLAVREIHPSHYGRICPIETPEGPNAGLVGSITTYARINKHGFIESPFYKVRDKIVNRNVSPFFLSAEQEENAALAPGDLLISSNGELQIRDKLIPIRYKQEFTTALPENVNYMAISPIQMISVATALIPFLEHDDANRALMGSNMQRQAVPVINSQRPVVGTGLELQTARDCGSTIIAKKSGFVQDVSAEKIIIDSSPTYLRNFTDHTNKYKNFSKSLRFQSLITEPIKRHKKFIKFKDLSNLFLDKKISIDDHLLKLIANTKKDKIKKRVNEKNLDIYKLQKYQRSNQDTCINQKPLVHQGEWVKKGDILADGASTSKGELALGQNILIAYMPWEGYNFEDAILISERLVQDNVYTSIHIEKYEVQIQQTKLGPEETTKNIPNISNLATRYLDKNGIIIPGTWVESGDILVGKVTPKGESDQTPEGRLLRAIFGEKGRDVKNTSLKVPNGVKGRVIDIQIFQKTSIHVYLAQKRKIQVGDKIAGRHGNKGIISNILPCQDMPYLQDGTPVDMVLNPLGVPSRMNVGQVLECLLGLAGKNLDENYKIVPFDEMHGNETSRNLVYNKLYEARKKTGHKWLFDPNSPGKSRLFDGRTGESFEQPITVGYAYMLKLVHLVDDKIHARSTGPYSLVTQQPLGGRAKNGGQRLGEMEVWALEGFGAAYTLQELLTVKSDDIKGRNDALNAIIKGKTIPNPGTPESFKVLIRELQSLCLDIGLYNIDKFNNTKEIDIIHMK
uniref:DNA-directed RNA polymerase subunit beta n=1 Tax=Eutreptiella pomquetensis TaxID=215699 RepID=A0A223FM12_9EUGL|nr:RNA polymerase beta subunit [Eutreptiella pomquetensis]